jgi:N-acyl-L-homoserine lactone synthetase
MEGMKPARVRSARLFFPVISPQVLPEATTRERILLKEAAEQPQDSRADPLLGGALKATTLTFTNIHKHGDLFVDFMRMRHKVFIEGKGWDLPETDGIEFDQYDTAQARMIAIHSYGEVLAGIRLLPTTSRVGLHSYMLRDAQLGLLDSLPRDILFFEAPVSPLIWEATRLFIKPDVPAKLRAQVQVQLMTEMAKVAREAGATHVIGIVPAVFRRWMARIGMSASPVGAPLVIDGDKVCAALFPVIEFVN